MKRAKVVKHTEKKKDLKLQLIEIVWKECKQKPRGLAKSFTNFKLTPQNLYLLAVLHLPGSSVRAFVC